MADPNSSPAIARLQSKITAQPESHLTTENQLNESPRYTSSDRAAHRQALCWATYCEALKELTRERVPLQWAVTQNINPPIQAGGWPLSIIAVKE
jgi:hypothetical protein